MVPAVNKAKRLRWSTIPKKQFIIIIFKEFSLKPIQHTFSEDESPTLKGHI